jgi:glucoamylase
VIFRVQTSDLTPTFGSPLGAQMVDAFVTNPDDATTSNESPNPGRNYSLETGWNRLIEVQGFGQQFVNTAGAGVGSVDIKASAITRYITFTVPASALGGTPTSGWSFAVVLTGQGLGTNAARDFSPTAQDFSFGVCTDAEVAAGNTICSVDPTTVPRAVDILTPGGVYQAQVLDPREAQAPVQIPSVTIP